MTPEPDSRRLFDRWAEIYDRTVSGSIEFPLAGYERVLASVGRRAEVEPGMSVLDLGTGTGNLAGVFLEQECSVWAIDFSPRMIERARTKYPSIQLSIGDLRDGVPASFPDRYDRIVSAYAFHHLDLHEKGRLVADLAREHLVPGGRILVADVSFSTVREREAARSRLAHAWDPDEYYWAEDETTALLSTLHLTTSYEQVSFCGGVFVIQPSGSDG